METIKPKTKKSKWKNNLVNSILIRKGYFISFNPMPVIGGVGPETALCKNVGNNIFGRGEMLILNGDFRNQYEKCKSYAECEKFYKSKKAKYRSSWSEDK